MQLDNPTKTLIPAPSKEDNTCACSECAFMKVNTLEKLYQCLQDEHPEVHLDNEIIEKAFTSYSKNVSAKLKIMQNLETDILIVGTGLVGLSLAKYLSEQNRTYKLFYLAKPLLTSAIPIMLKVELP